MADGGGAETANQVFASNLPRTIDDRRLEELFSHCGEVLEAKVIKDRETGRSRRFGIVTFIDREAVEAAVESMHEKPRDGHHILVCKHVMPRR
ncbi:hypothetical protein ACQ4PT_062736 [Festuca glaucescens]